MEFRVQVLLKRTGREVPTDIGVKAVDPRPIRFGKTTFTHEGKTRVGRIESLEPPNWESRPDTLPRILVMLNKPD